VFCVLRSMRKSYTHPSDKRALKTGDIVSSTADGPRRLLRRRSDHWCRWARKLPRTEEAARSDRASLYKGIEQVKIGNTVGHVGSAIQKHVEANGFSVGGASLLGMVSGQAARSAADSKLCKKGQGGLTERHGLGDRADGQRGRSETKVLSDSGPP